MQISKITNNGSNINFSANSKQANAIVDLAFDKLNKARKGNNLAQYFGTTPRKVNVYINETIYGKSAELSFNNGKFWNKNYAKFILNRNANDSKVLTEDNTLATKAYRRIKKYLESLNS